VIESESAGTGEPLVLLHAGVCDMRMWDVLWPRLTAGRHVLRADLQGFGRSPVTGAEYCHAGDVAELIQAQGVGPATVVGCSMSGRVAVELAVAHPELVSRLVLVDAGLPDHDWSAALQEFGAAEDAALEAGDLDAAVELNLRMWVDGPQRTPAEPDPAVRELVGRMQRRAFELYLAAPDAEERPLVEGVGGRLGEVAAPSLVIAGELDVPDFLDIARRLASGIPSARLVTLPAAAHLPSMERPDEFAALVEAFLGS